MVDILKRLRENHCRENEGCNALDICACTRMEEAADYIAKLEAELHSMTARYDAVKAKYDFNLEQNQKLRDAPDRIIDALYKRLEGKIVVGGMVSIDLVRIAIEDVKQALGVSDE